MADIPPPNCFGIPSSTEEPHTPSPSLHSETAPPLRPVAAVSHLDTSAPMPMPTPTVPFTAMPVSGPPLSFSSSDVLVRYPYYFSHAPSTPWSSSLPLFVRPPSSLPPPPSSRPLSNSPNFYFSSWTPTVTNQPPLSLPSTLPTSPCVSSSACSLSLPGLQSNPDSPSLGVSNLPNSSALPSTVSLATSLGPIQVSPSRPTSISSGPDLPCSSTADQPPASPSPHPTTTPPPSFGTTSLSSPAALVSTPE